jgi:hypothetical protein
MVDQMLALPAHHVNASRSGGGEGALSPAFSRLFQRFRIGKTHFVYEDPETGAERREPVVRCADCHVAEPALGDGQGHRVAEDQIQRMRELTSLTARAERILLRARASGVLVQSALSSLDGAVDAQIELEALVHAFRTDPESAFAKKHAEGLEHARGALTGGREALAELAARRRGLAVALGVITLVLIGLGLKIRRLGDDGPAATTAANPPPR